MKHVLVVGAGLAGCTVAQSLAENGARVTMIEASRQIGGKVRNYGCKATDRCNNCGVCLASGLWEKVEGNTGISIHFGCKLVDLMRETDKSFTAAITCAGTISTIEKIDRVVVATGFEQTTTQTFNGFVELEGEQGVITGSQIDALMKERTTQALFETPPKSVAFIQCYGSRDQHEHTMYCSRVCCNYATKAAKVIKHFHPECRIVFYYMEMQMVSQGDWFCSLTDLGIEFVKCRPTQVKGGAPASVTYDNPLTGARETEQFDLVVLSDGIRPGSGARKIAELCGLVQDEAGFLSAMDTGRQQDIWLAGCAKGPKKIEETYADAIAVAKGILFAQEAIK